MLGWFFLTQNWLQNSCSPNYFLMLSQKKKLIISDILFSQFPTVESSSPVAFLARECDLLRLNSNCHVLWEVAFYSPHWKDLRFVISCSRMDWQIPHIHTSALDQKLLQQQTSQALMIHWPMKLWGNEGLGSNMNCLKFHFTLRQWWPRGFEHYKPRLACWHLTSSVSLSAECQEIPSPICAFMDKICLWWTDRGFCWKLNVGSF